MTETHSEIIAYHDETKDVPGANYKGHILFLVPKHITQAQVTPLFGTRFNEYSALAQLHDQIQRIRREFGIGKKLHFNDISGKKWGRFDVGVRQVVAAGVDALRRKRPNLFTAPLHCRLAVMFYPRKSNVSLYGGDSKKERILRHDETVLRILLKGAVHYLYQETDNVIISEIVSDGDPHHRRLDAERILWRILVDDTCGRSALRNYVSISEGAQITQLPSDHKKYNCDSEQYAHSNMLQLTDLLLGCVIRSCHVGCRDFQQAPPIGCEVASKRDVIAFPIKEMLEKQLRGKGFRTSGHYRSFVIGSIQFMEKEREVVFSGISPKRGQEICDNLTLAFHQSS
jgi:hypothetical protein